MCTNEYVNQSVSSIAYDKQSIYAILCKIHTLWSNQKIMHQMSATSNALLMFKLPKERGNTFFKYNLNGI